MQKLIWQNANGEEINLTSGNYGITEWEGFSNASLNIQSQQVPFQDGGVFLDALIEQRELSVTLKMQDNGNLEERYRMRRELIHALNPKLGEGYLIYTNDFTSKRIKCVPQIPLFETHNSNDSGTPKASLAWTACEPYWEDLEETTVELFPNVNKIINNNGDVSTGLDINVIGGGSNFIIKNFTENKSIKYQNEFATGININTNSGKKSVESLSSYKFNYSNGGIFKCVTKKDGYIYAFGDIALRLYGNNKEILNLDTNLIQDVASSSEMILALYSAYIMRSYDGINWEKTSNITALDSVIQYSENEGCFIISTPYNRVKTTDGAVFTQYSGTTEIKNKKQIKVGNTYIRANQNLIQTSTDEVVWETVFSTEGVINEIVYKDDEYIVTTRYAEIYASKNLSIWENKNSSVCMSEIYNIVSAFGKLWCCGEGGWRLAYSEDNGNTWIKFNYTSELNTQTIYDMIYFKNKLIVPIGGSSKYLIINEDMTYQEKTLEGVNFIPFKIHIYEDMLYITNGGLLLISQDIGQTFTSYWCFTEGDETPLGFEDVIYANGVWWGATSYRYGSSSGVYIYKCTNLTDLWVFVENINTETSVPIHSLSFACNEDIIIGGTDYNLIFKIVDNEITIIKNFDPSASSEILRVVYNSGCFYCIGMNLNVDNYEKNIMFLIDKYGNDIQTVDIQSNALGNVFRGIAFYKEYIVLVGNIIILNTNSRQNAINNIVSGSDMNLNLKPNGNDMLFTTSDELKCFISYRQKYIGV